MERSDKFLVGGKRATDPAGFDVSRAFGELGIDDAALALRVLVGRAGLPFEALARANGRCFWT